MGDLAYARELAIANNQPVEVWFLRPSGGKQITGLQINLIDQTGTGLGPTASCAVCRPAWALTRARIFRRSWRRANQKTFGGSQPQPTIPGYQANYSAWYVRFMPDGSTSAAKYPAVVCDATRCRAGRPVDGGAGQLCHDQHRSGGGNG